MKKILAATAALALFGLGIYAVHPLEAHAGTPYSQQSVIGRTWESGVVAAGAIVQSPVLLLDNVSECVVTADNSAGGSTRVLNIDWIVPDQAPGTAFTTFTTIGYRQAVSITTGLRVAVGIGSVSQTASLPTGITVVPVAIGKRMQVTLTAVGAANGSVAVYCR